MRKLPHAVMRRTTPQIVVRLRVTQSALGLTEGMSNLFFEPPSAGSALPTHWDSAGTATLGTIAGKEVVIARGWAGGRWEYRVDRDLNGALGDEAPLRMAPTGQFEGASLELSVPGRPEVKVRYHVLTAGGYTYARVATEWHGSLAANGKRYQVRIRPASRMNPIPTLGQPVEFHIDSDRDGTFQIRGGVDRQQRPVHSELINTSEAFGLNGKRYRVTSIALDSHRMVIEESTESSGTAPGLTPPTFSTMTLDGDPVSTSQLRGVVTVIEFWSVHCPFSEQIRPELLKLQNRLGSGVRWVAIAREQEPDAVRAHLREHSMTGEHWRSTDALWGRFNPETVTPLFYVVNRDGTIVAVERGAGAAAVLEATLRGLLGNNDGTARKAR